MDKEDVEKSIDNVSSTEKEIAQNVLSEFNKDNYASSYQHISKLEDRIDYDFKVAHNKIVLEYYKSDLKKLDVFQKSLLALFNKFHLKLEKLDDVDHCALHYNQALLLYHQRQYSAALRIMDRVYKFIEPMDDILSKQAGLLMIELQLCIKQPEKALSFITYLQNQCVNGNTSNIKLLSKTITNTLSEKEEIKEKQEKPVAINTPLTPAAEIFLKKLVKYRAMCYLMNHSLRLAKKEIQEFGNQGKMNVDYLLLQANFEYMTGSYQESMKILSSIPENALQYNEHGESSTVIFYNNMGVIHHSLGKPNLAAHYFQLALKEDNAITPKDLTDKQLYTIGGSKYHEIMYNLGISLLYARKPVQAFECLVVAVRRYHRNSRLWLRLAECCIMTHKESNELDFDLSKKRDEYVVETIGKGGNRRVVLNTNLSKDKKYSTESQSYAVPVPTLEFAILCLRNAEELLPSDTAVPVPLLLIPGVTPPMPPPSPGPAPSNTLCPDDLISLRNSIYITTAYVSLCIGDYIVTLENTNNLLEQPRKSGIHVLLAHLYAAEAYIFLDKLTDAIEHLNPETIKDISHELPSEPPTGEEDILLKTNPPFRWFPSTTASAIATMQYNLAVVMAIKGQLDQALSLLKQIWHSRSPNYKVPAHIIMLVLYIELKLGHTDRARMLIKQHTMCVT
nr:CCR4-NOT transcription complex subunit 10 [Onthophagus taurus]